MNYDRKLVGLLIWSMLLLVACTDEMNPPTSNPELETIRYLALGDSYTIGESVCTGCSFPLQLRDSLNRQLGIELETTIVAQTGWTTSRLIQEIQLARLRSDYQLVSLLIGVNNQFQNIPFSVYEEEFPNLVQTAIRTVSGNPGRLIVVSIPDYAYTPYGQNFTNQPTVSSELDAYNQFAKNYCAQQGVSFINITDITREGLVKPDLVANDGLHPSTKAYTQFVNRLLPIALEKLQV